MVQCCVKTKKGVICKNRAKSNGSCSIHTRKRSPKRTSKKSPRRSYVKKSHRRSSKSKIVSKPSVMTEYVSTQIPMFSKPKSVSQPAPQPMSALQQLLSLPPVLVPSQSASISDPPAEISTSSNVCVMSFAHILCSDKDKFPKDEYNRHKVEIPNDEKYKDDFKNMVKNYLLKRLLTFPEYKIIYMGHFDSSNNKLFSLHNVMVETKGESTVTLFNTGKKATDIINLIKNTSGNADCCEIYHKSVAIYPSVLTYHSEDQIPVLKLESYYTDWYVLKIKFESRDSTINNKQLLYEYIKTFTFDIFKDNLNLYLKNVNVELKGDITVHVDELRFLVRGTTRDINLIKMNFKTNKLLFMSPKGIPEKIDVDYGLVKISPFGVISQRLHEQN